MLPMTSSTAELARSSFAAARTRHIVVIIIIRHWANNRFTRAGRRAPAPTCNFFAGRRDVPIELPGTVRADDGRTTVIKM